VRDELRRRKLRIVKTTPPLTGFEFVVAYPLDIQPASKLIMQLAIEAAAENPLAAKKGEHNLKSLRVPKLAAQ
jgi:hypothetical protein